ncbi:MAG: hypothetical protein PVG89_01400 [Gammaproteobacteria bacterium]|jgi:hypothetical protein
MADDPADNPYQAPKATLERPDSGMEIPEDVLKKIRNGWVAAVISGGITLLITVAAMYGADFTGFGGPELIIDVVLIFVLAYGIYKKSRVAATFMLVYFIFSKIIIWSETGQFNGIILALVFLYFYTQAMIGTFQYHRLKSASEDSV